MLGMVLQNCANVFAFPQPQYDANDRTISPPHHTPSLTLSESDPLHFLSQKVEQTWIAPATEETDRVSDWVKSQHRSVSLDLDDLFPEQPPVRLPKPSLLQAPPSRRTRSRGQAASTYVPPPRMQAPAPQVAWWDASCSPLRECDPDEPELFYATSDNASPAVKIESDLEVKAPRPSYPSPFQYGSYEYDFNLNLDFLDTPPLSPTHSSSSDSSASTDDDLEVKAFEAWLSSQRVPQIMPHGQRKKGGKRATGRNVAVLDVIFEEP